MCWKDKSNFCACPEGKLPVSFLALVDSSFSTYPFFSHVSSFLMMVFYFHNGKLKAIFVLPEGKLSVFFLAPVQSFLVPYPFFILVFTSTSFLQAIYITFWVNFYISFVNWVYLKWLREGMLSSPPGFKSHLWHVLSSWVDCWGGSLLLFRLARYQKSHSLLWVWGWDELYLKKKKSCLSFPLLLSPQETSLVRSLYFIGILILTFYRLTTCLFIISWFASCVAWNG